MEYLLHILIMICIYVILAQSLNLVIGYTGIISIAHAAFYGIGAYTVALMSLKLGTPFSLNMVCAITLSGLCGALIGVPSARLKGDSFVVITFGFQIITFSILNNCVALTGGPMGLPGIPRPDIFGWRISSHYEFLILAVLLTGVIFLVSRRITESPFGRILKAIREDEMFAIAAGKDVAMCKILVFIISSSMAAVAGAIYAYYISYIDPTSFTINESIFIISLVIIGGAGSLWGPVVGAVVLVILPELLRFVGIPSSLTANLRQILYGGLLVVFMIWRPQGLVGEYGFQFEKTKK